MVMLAIFAVRSYLIILTTVCAVLARKACQGTGEELVLNAAGRFGRKALAFLVKAICLVLNVPFHPFRM